MKKFKELGLIMTVVMGTLIFAACGGSNSNPEDVADKFMKGMLQENLQSEEKAKEVKALMHSDFSEEEKDENIEYYSITGMAKGLFSKSEREEMKEFGIDKKMDDLVDVMRKSIKIERVKSEVEGDVANANYKVSIPKIDEDILEAELEKASKKIRDDIINRKIELDEGMKQVMILAVDMYVEAFKATKEFDEEDGHVELKKVDGNWFVSRF